MTTSNTLGVASFAGIQAITTAPSGATSGWHTHFITDELIRRGSHTSVPALEADIRTWATAWNDDPKPFIWTKTAEQILDSIGRLLTRISGAAH